MVRDEKADARARLEASEVLLPKGEVGRSYLEFLSYLVVPSEVLLYPPSTE